MRLRTEEETKVAGNLLHLFFFSLKVFISALNKTLISALNKDRMCLYRSFIFVTDGVPYARLCVNFTRN